MESEDEAGKGQWKQERRKAREPHFPGNLASDFLCPLSFFLDFLRFLSGQPLSGGHGFSNGRDGSHRMRPRVVTLVGSLLAGACCCRRRPAALRGRRARPNVVLIIADDLGCDSLRGVRQPERENAETSTLVAPGRVAVRPGLRDGQFVQPEPVEPHHRALYPARHRRRGVARAVAARSGHVRREAQEGAGYWTAAAGKWHLGNAVKGPVRPRARRQARRAFAGGTGKMTAEGPVGRAERLRSVGANAP